MVWKHWSYSPRPPTSHNELTDSPKTLTQPTIFKAVGPAAQHKFMGPMLVIEVGGVIPPPCPPVFLHLYLPSIRRVLRNPSVSHCASLPLGELDDTTPNTNISHNTWYDTSHVIEISSNYKWCSFKFQWNFNETSMWLIEIALKFQWNFNGHHWSFIEISMKLQWAPLKFHWNFNGHRWNFIEISMGSIEVSLKFQWATIEISMKLQWPSLQFQWAEIW